MDYQEGWFDREAGDCFLFILHIANLFFGLLFDIPVVICAESIGPFKKKWNKRIAKKLLNKATLILVREDISTNHLRDIGVNKPPIHVTNDFAFLLKPAPSERVELLASENNIELTNKNIGISLSKIIANYGFKDIQDNSEKYKKYIRIIADVVDYLIIQFNATVILIPHVIEPKNDDRIVNRDVYELVNHKNSCKLLEKDYQVIYMVYGN